MRLYHNPRCSKSRQALELLKERSIDFEEYRYLDRGIMDEDFEILLELDQLIRTIDLNDEISFDPEKKDELRRILTSHPRLLQRPILVHEGKAVIGRPPEEILTLLP